MRVQIVMEIEAVQFLVPQGGIKEKEKGELKRMEKDSEKERKSLPFWELPDTESK